MHIIKEILKTMITQQIKSNGHEIESAPIGSILTAKAHCDMLFEKDSVLSIKEETAPKDEVLFCCVSNSK